MPTTEARKRTHPTNPERGDVYLWLIGGLPAILFVAILGFAIANMTHVEHRTCTVVDKDRTRTDDGSDARVYTEECGVLRVADSLLSWTWSSSDTYAQMERDRTYRVKTRGFRIPLFSQFPNVVEVEEVK